MPFGDPIGDDPYEQDDIKEIWVSATSDGTLVEFTDGDVHISNCPCCMESLRYAQDEIVWIGRAFDSDQHMLVRFADATVYCSSCGRDGY